MNSENIETKKKVEIKKIKFKNKFELIRSKYILKKVFNNLKRKKSLYIIRFNENIKKD